MNVTMMRDIIDMLPALSKALGKKSEWLSLSRGVAVNDVVLCGPGLNILVHTRKQENGGMFHRVDVQNLLPGGTVQRSIKLVEEYIRPEQIGEGPSFGPMDIAKLILIGVLERHLVMVKRSGPTKEMINAIIDYFREEVVVSAGWTVGFTGIDQHGVYITANGGTREHDLGSMYVEVTISEDLVIRRLITEAMLNAVAIALLSEPHYADYSIRAPF